MSKGFPNLGKKPAPADPGSYIRDYARNIKRRNPRKDESPSTSRVKLLPSTKPIPIELPAADTSISAIGFLTLVVAITLPILFLLLFLKNS
ncbi:hypothetical protein V2O64_21290 [Verrucomicrobiaceae bacterium 227]